MVWLQVKVMLSESHFLRTEKSSKLEKLVWCLLLSSFSSPEVKRVNASAEATSAGEVPVIGVTGW